MANVGIHSAPIRSAAINRHRDSCHKKLALAPYVILVRIAQAAWARCGKRATTRLDRIVAIKRRKREHSARFEQETRAIAALNHGVLVKNPRV